MSWIKLKIIARFSSAFSLLRPTSSQSLCNTVYGDKAEEYLLRVCKTEEIGGTRPINSDREEEEGRT